MGDEANRRLVRRSSDELLAAIDDLKAAERQKRGAEMSTPEFHRLAEEVSAKADALWRTATEEEDAGDALSERQGVTIDEVLPDNRN